MIKVLVVDDDFMVARIHSGFIASCTGFTTIATAHDAVNAIALTKEHQPDLILLDIYLPDRSGLEIIPDLRQAGPESDIMIISAAREAATIRNTVRQGVIDYLLKPFSRETLRERLAAYAVRRQRLAAVDVQAQVDVDRVVHGTGTADRPVPDRLPKGISPETAELVVAKLRSIPDTLSASQAGESLGISRVSARRYLEWLVSVGRAEVTLRYGGQGRPERRYRAK